MVWFQIGNCFLKWLNMLWYLSSQLFPAMCSIGQINMCAGSMELQVSDSDKTITTWLWSITTRLFILSDIRLCRLTCTYLQTYFYMIWSGGKCYTETNSCLNIQAYVKAKRSYLPAPRSSCCPCSFCGTRKPVSVSKPQKFSSRRLNALVAFNANLSLQSCICFNLIYSLKSQRTFGSSAYLLLFWFKV